MVTTEEVNDFLYDLVEEEGKALGKRLKEAIDEGEESPISLVWGVDNILKDHMPVVHYLAMLHLNDDDGGVHPGELAEAYLEEIGEASGWFVHGDEGDGSQVWLCDGTCEMCKRYDEESDDTDWGNYEEGEEEEEEWT